MRKAKHNCSPRCLEKNALKSSGVEKNQKFNDVPQLVCSFQMPSNFVKIIVLTCTRERRATFRSTLWSDCSQLRYFVNTIHAVAGPVKKQLLFEINRNFVYIIEFIIVCSIPGLLYPIP